MLAKNLVVRSGNQLRQPVELVELEGELEHVAEAELPGDGVHNLQYTPS